MTSAELILLGMFLFGFGMIAELILAVYLIRHS